MTAQNVLKAESVGDGDGRGVLVDGDTTLLAVDVGLIGGIAYLREEFCCAEELAMALQTGATTTAIN